MITTSRITIKSAPTPGREVGDDRTVTPDAHDLVLQDRGEAVEG